MNQFTRDYEDWHRYGKERGFFDRVSDEVRSWFGDEDAERRRQQDQHMGHLDNISGQHYQTERPQWQDRHYSGSSPRGSHANEMGRFDEPGRQQRGLRRMPSYGERGNYGREDRSYLGRNQERGFMHEDERGFGRSYYESDMLGDEGLYGRPLPHRSWDEDTSRGPRFFDDERYARESGLSGRSHRGRGPRNYQRSDERVSDEIHQILTYHPELDATNIEVMVEAGIVTLKGAVDCRFSKRLAEDIIDEVYGVKEVRNELRVNNNSNTLSSNTGMTGQEQLGRDRIGNSR